ncbi:hypothetical protein [Hirschia maritima]|uniref:hypothetical protein n=1 Tax=Hirschia maritima TaxID=1121961 RepID=UPI000367B3E3|nr:hypothetical protein [Hirschia maritima]
MVTVTDNTLTNVGKRSTHRSGASMYFHGVQRLNISDTTWNDGAPLELFLTNGGPITVIGDIQLINSGKIEANSEDYSVTNISYE